MSSRDTLGTSLRQLADLRVAAAEIEHELRLLRDEQNHLDKHMAACHRLRRQTPRRKFWRGVGLGMFVVTSVWTMALGVAHLVVNP